MRVKCYGGNYFENLCWLGSQLLLFFTRTLIGFDLHLLEIHVALSIIAAF